MRAPAAVAKKCGLTTIVSLPIAGWFMRITPNPKRCGFNLMEDYMT
jgi:hypothetical protein